MAKKIAELQKKIDHLVTVKTNEADSSGNSDVEIRTQTTFNVNLTGVEKVVSQCIENEGNYKCYTALEMPKASAVESATASVRENDGKYRELIASEEYQKLLAEFR